MTVCSTRTASTVLIAVAKWSRRASSLLDAWERREVPSSTRFQRSRYWRVCSTAPWCLENIANVIRYALKFWPSGWKECSYFRLPISTWFLGVLFRTLGSSLLFFLCWERQVPEINGNTMVSFVPFFMLAVPWNTSHFFLIVHNRVHVFHSYKTVSDCHMLCEARCQSPGSTRPQRTTVLLDGSWDR